MTHLFKLARRSARLRAPVSVAIALAYAGCSSDSLTSPASEPASANHTTELNLPSSPSFSTTFRGGIAFGNFHQPTSTMGGQYNGAMRNIYPGELLSELRAIRDRGGKVVLNLAGAPPRYTDGSGYFSLSMWKASVDRYKDVDFTQFIQDGTVIGHFLLDEPNDATNWNGRVVSGSTVEEMARYSKSRWPGLPTIVRARPDYMTGSYQYLDAAWAQYHSKFGDPARFASENIADAKARGLALVMGLNIIDGNGGSKMTASQIESWGSALLADTYSCAFLSWQYDDGYLDRSDIAQAMKYLSAKAANRTTRTCRGPTTTTTAGSSTGGIVLAIDAIFSKNGRDYVRLKWSGGRTATVDAYRNGVFRRNTENDGRQSFIRPLGTATSYKFKLCEAGSSTCSNTVTAVFD